MYRLLLKTHNQTGLKYLCKTEDINWKKYCGSGTYWKRHLKIHGRDIATDLLFETENFDEFRKVAVFESISRNIVKSEEYANLKMEEGDGGDTSKTQAYIDGMKMRDNAGMKNGMWGKQRPDLVERNKLGVGKSIGESKIVTCPHCGKSGRARGMGRWHFDNCKDKPLTFIED